MSLAAWRENPELTPAQRGLAYALELHATADPKTWRGQVDAIADPDERRAANDYLAGIVIRTKAWRAANLTTKTTE